MCFYQNISGVLIKERILIEKWKKKTLPGSILLGHFCISMNLSLKKAISMHIHGHFP